MEGFDILQGIEKKQYRGLGHSMHADEDLAN